MDKNSALRIAQDYAKQIISGEVEPYEGAKLIVEEAIYKCDGENQCPELDYMSGLEDEYLEFHKDYRIEFYGNKKTKELIKQTELQIIDEARDILKIKV